MGSIAVVDLRASICHEGSESLTVMLLAFSELFSSSRVRSLLFASHRGPDYFARRLARGILHRIIFQ
ncbi:hypothetical protein AOLI_G00056690 [Acnodon oligacanthus]